MRRDLQRKSGSRQDSGLATVEFILTFFVVVFLIFTILEVFMMMYTYNVLADAAKEGVRYAIVHGGNNSSSSGPSSGTGCGSTCTCTSSSTNVTSVTTVVQNYAKTSFHDISGMTVNVCYWDGTNKPPGRVYVVIHYPYKSFINVGWAKPTINAAAEGRIIN